MGRTGADSRVAAAGAGRSFPKFLERTEALWGGDCQERLAESHVAVAGLGGVGGAVLPLLVRMGVGHFTIADPGIFDDPDMNRQTAATLQTLGRNKAEVYEEFIKSVNPAAEVRVFKDGVTDANVADFVGSSDVVVDALDLRVPSPLRLKLADVSREKAIHNVTSPIIGFGTAVAVASPTGMSMADFMKLVEEVRTRGKLPPGFVKFFQPEHIEIVEDRIKTRKMVPTIALAPALSGALAVAEILMILCKDVLPGWRPPVCLPELFLFDLARMSYRVARIEDVL